MPEPQFTDDDFENPTVPEDQRLLLREQYEVRDLSYDSGATRNRQMEDLYKGALIEIDDFDERPADRSRGHHQLVLFAKDRPRGHGYVCDFLYASSELPVRVYGTLVNRGSGLTVHELELWRSGASDYRDEWGCYTGPESGPSRDEDLPYQGVTADVLRAIPLGRIVESAQRRLASDQWRDEGVHYFPSGRVHTQDEVRADIAAQLEAINQMATLPPRGRPKLSDDFLAGVAQAYLEESARGRGVMSRLASRFDRPEPTIRHWIATARQRGHLAPSGRTTQGRPR